MIILTIRTDKPDAELCLYKDTTQLECIQWQAHRQLAETIHAQITQLLKKHDKTLHDIHGIGCYKGPGSFTGLRIGLTVANALAYSLKVPIFGATGENWHNTAIDTLLAGHGASAVLPEYGADVHITAPKQ